MSKSPWGTIGAWAADAERAEEEEREAAAQPPASFPSLKESATTATKQKKKTKMTLQEFTMQQQQQPYSSSRGEEILRLPKDRSPDEMRLGGGFSNYGPQRGSDSGRRSYGFQDEGGLQQPERADNWASMKRPIAPEYDSRGKYSSLGGASRADEVDNWASVKKPVSQQQRRSSSGGFSRPEEEGRWTGDEKGLLVSEEGGKNEVVKVNKANPFGAAARPREEVLADKGLDWKKLDLGIEVKKEKNSVSGGSRPASSQSSRPETPLSSRGEVIVPGVGENNAVKQKPKVNPFGDAKPREVLLEEKGLDWKKIDLDLEHRRVERPETEEEKNLKEEIERLKKELPQKSSDDQTSIHDLILQRERELESLGHQLDDKVRYSQKNFERQGSGAGFNERPPSRPGAYEEHRSGFNERPPSRPGAYEEHRTASMDRPPSRGGAYEDSRAERPPSRHRAYEESRGGSSFRTGAYQEPEAVDYNERPRSRGTMNSWTRPSDDRRAIQGGGGGGRGFFGSRDTDRSGSRW